MNKDNVLRDRECIKFPECLGCSRIVRMRWEFNGALVRCCSAYLFPSRIWKKPGGCPVFAIHEKRHESNKIKVRAGLYKAPGRKG